MSTYYKSQYHYEDDFDKEKQSHQAKNLVIQGSEMQV